MTRAGGFGVGGHGVVGWGLSLGKGIVRVAGVRGRGWGWGGMEMRSQGGSRGGEGWRWDVEEIGEIGREKGT